MAEAGGESGGEAEAGLTIQRCRARVVRNTGLRHQLARERSRAAAACLPSPVQQGRHRLLAEYLATVVRQLARE